jgi:hypothetical protein
MPPSCPAAYNPLLWFIISLYAIFLALSIFKSIILTFFCIFTDNIVMYSKFWENVRDKLDGIKDSQKWLSEASGVKRTTINNGISKIKKPETEGNSLKNSPSVDNSYSIARALKTTIEELVDGEAGIEYLRQYFLEKGLLWKPPSRIADIVEVLESVDDITLDTVRIMILPLKEKKDEYLSTA